MSDGNSGMKKPRAKDINRAISMADAAPVLSSTPRSQPQHQPDSTFQDGDTFDISGKSGAAGANAGANGRSGGSSLKKPGRCVRFPLIIQYSYRQRPVSTTVPTVHYSTVQYSGAASIASIASIAREWSVSLFHCFIVSLLYSFL